MTSYRYVIIENTKQAITKQTKSFHVTTLLSSIVANGCYWHSSSILKLQQWSKTVLKLQTQFYSNNMSKILLQCDNVKHISAMYDVIHQSLCNLWEKVNHHCTSIDHPSFLIVWFLVTESPSFQTNDSSQSRICPRVVSSLEAGTYLYSWSSNSLSDTVRAHLKLIPDNHWTSSNTHTWV